MKKLEFIPTYDELNDYYGNPDIDRDFVLDAGYVESKMLIVTAPYPMWLSWDPETYVTAIQVHRIIAPVVVDAFMEIREHRDHAWLMEQQLDCYGGGFAFRPMRGGTKLTTHAWCAIDINPNKAPYREKGSDGAWINEQPDFIRDVFLRRGFTSFIHDGMHFQACLSDSPSALYDETVQKTINRSYSRRHKKGKYTQLTGH